MTAWNGLTNKCNLLHFQEDYQNPAKCGFIDFWNIFVQMRCWVHIVEPLLAVKIGHVDKKNVFSYFYEL